MLVWKAGNTRQGIRSAATHTANMTGTYDVWRAALRQSGIIEVQSMDEAADFVKALMPRRYPRGRNTAVVTASGGAAVIYSDAADHYGLELQTPAAATRAVLEKAFPKAATLQNPVDLAANGFDESSQPGYERAVEALLKDPGVDQICPMFSAMSGHPMKLMAEVLGRIFLRSDKPMIAFSSVPREVAQSAFQVLEEAGIPVLGSPNGVVRGCAMLADYAAMRARLLVRTFAASPVQAGDVDMTPGTVLDEVQSKRMISDWLPVTRDVVVSPVDASALGTMEVNFPVAVKIVSPDIAHKTDVGGVVLHVQDREALKSAWDTVISNALKYKPQARLTGVLVSEMVSDGVETLVGVVDDEVFGPVVACGMGGVLAEVLRDVTYRVAPFDEQVARDMIRELRSWPVFQGVRGKPPADVEALAQALVKVSHFAWASRETVSEVDINPLLVRPVTRTQGTGVIAADAVIVLRRA